MDIKRFDFYFFFCFWRYCFPFGRPEGALKATLSLLERVCFNITLQILFTLSIAGCLSCVGGQSHSSGMCSSLSTWCFTNFSCFLAIFKISPIPCFFLPKPFWRAAWLHMLSWWHLLGNFLFLNLFSSHHEIGVVVFFNQV